MTTQNNYQKLRKWLLLGNALGILTALLLLYPGITFLIGGSSIASERFNVPIDTDSASQLALIAGFYKGIVDIMLIPIGFATYFSRNYKLLAWVLFTGLLFIPIFDLLGAAASKGNVIVHMPYIVVMGLCGFAYWIAKDIQPKNLEK
jgi:hypothetical protein